MIIDKITLHDFGVYAGSNEIRLTPISKEKPVILFYGLNGTGKTTILEALQIILLGPQAKCIGGESYKTYILKRINKKSRYGQSAVKLAFRRTEGGQETTYNISRIWKKSGSNIKESLEVVRNGYKKKQFADNWDQSIDQILPSQISHFFFFDGEKVEDYASPEGGQELISSGIRNLLGLDIVAQLQDDLKIIERRRKSETLSDSTQKEIEQLNEDLSVAEDEADRLQTEKAVLQTRTVDVLKREMRCHDANFQQMGGKSAEQQREIDQKLAAVKERISTIRGAMIELTSGLLPVALVPELLDDLTTFHQLFDKINAAKAVLNVLENRDEDILTKMKVSNISQNAVDTMSEYLFEDRKQRKSPLSMDIDYPDEGELAGIDIKHIQQHIISNQKKVNTVIDQMNEAQDIQDSAMATQASVASDEDLSEVLKDRARIQEELTVAEISVQAIDQNLNKTRKNIANLKECIENKLQKNIELDILHKKTKQYLTRMADGKKILNIFREKILNRNLQRIESLVLDSYQTLLHKENLVKTIDIDPKTFQISLNPIDDHPLGTEQLSAGERQLLAISMLWGMARASARPFPVAVDTPLGRLDSEHRMKLIKHYFGRASHQVILFSTDEEIVNEYYDELKPGISRVFNLQHDDKSNQTTVSEMPL